MLKKPRYSSTVVMIVLSLIFFAGCRATQNQTIIPSEWQGYFNAAPVNKQYNETNSQHKVLVAVIDSGVDYNHPLLKKQIHYDIDSAGKVIGAGWDYVGNDPWPLPYLARTSHLYKKDKGLTRDNQEIANNISKLLQISPELSQWLHPARLHEDEFEQAIYHGTHVAGLSSYDDPRIGILPFRVLPETEGTDGTPTISLDTLYDYLEDAIMKSHKAGVKVVNLSIGMTFGKSDEGAENMINTFKKFEKLVNAYPDMVFVAAAGNESTWVNGETRFSFPCGVKATNMICVASVDENGVPSEFTNIPLVSNPLVFAPGERILAPLPSQLCGSEELMTLNGKLPTVALKKKAAKILKECPVKLASGVFPLSGTSMASPLIARAVALETLNLKTDANAAEIIESFMTRAQRTQYGPLSMVKFKLPLPSWYPKEAEGQGLGLAESSLTRGYFEFTMKR